MNASAQLHLERHDGHGLREQKAEVLSVFREAYAERLDEPFFHPDRFWERVESYASRDGFRLVTGRLEGQLVGFTLGGLLPPDTAWWRGLKSDVDAAFRHETGSRTFAIYELQVRPAVRRRGYAKALSSELLDGLAVERATLLVRAENVPAYTAYQSWGFEVIGKMQPFDDSPVYQVMVKELRTSGIRLEVVMPI
jgi:ribosomal protein S18 acetylase RimI-like enzyme